MFVHSLWKTLWTSGNTEWARPYVRQWPEKSTHKGWGQHWGQVAQIWGRAVDNVWTACEQSIWSSRRGLFTPWTTCGNPVDNPWMNTP
ncbi:hypothetical protein SAMN05421869_113313 [Nonomuraea jiangxiensis]|uniref:Uncharacterized protein n=1 Tax=Nonomuraea jiangxiensis TaxID=633440 RepID=A0A1G8YLI4_9ACTN|nr:hypothetical protein SAMN05421869_113313 [Nonomuraea jiangxiensis]